MHPESTPLAALELSRGATDFLQRLGVATLGDLLSVPELIATPRILSELHALFDHCGHEYAGDFVVVADTDTARASGSINERWARVCALCSEEFPEFLQFFATPAARAQLDAAERALGVQLPEDYKQFLTLHNGQLPGSPMVEAAALLPIELVVTRHAQLLGLFSPPEELSEEAIDAGVRATQYHPRWIPIGVSPRGRDVLCLDLAPAEGGHEGQVILVVLDDDSRTVIAASFADLISRLFDDLLHGDLEFDPEATGE